MYYALKMRLFQNYKPMIINNKYNVNKNYLSQSPPFILVLELDQKGAVMGKYQSSETAYRIAKYLFEQSLTYPFNMMDEFFNDFSKNRINYHINNNIELLPNHINHISNGKISIYVVALEIEELTINHFIWDRKFIYSQN